MLRSPLVTDNDLTSRLTSAVDNLRDEAIDLLRRLVAVPSVTGSEEAVQRVVAEEMRAMELDEVDVWEPNPTEMAAHAESIGHMATFAGRPNVVGIKRGSGGGRSLVLNAHIDTVDNGDPAFWTTDPLGGEIRDGRLYGRGSCDMKGGLVSELIAVRALAAAGVSLGGDVKVQSVISEEDGGAGTLAAILRGHTADAAIITEPTRTSIVTAQGGSLVFRLTVTGKSAHACVRDEGVSAIEKFALLHRALLDHESAHHAAIDHPLYRALPNRAPINIGIVRAGTWPSSVPETLVAEGRAGLVPGESLDGTRGAMLAVIAAVVESDPWLRAHPPVVEWFSGQFAAAEVDPAAEIVTTLAAAHRMVSAGDVVLEGVTYGADMRHFIDTGGMPCVMYGAGDVRVAHHADEFVPIDELLLVAKSLAVTMVDWCDVAPD
jgi:acetylornithine deacetylase